MFDLNDQESGAVNGGVTVAVATALKTTTEIAQEGLKNPNLTAREILQKQVDAFGDAAFNGAIAYLIPVILGFSTPVSVTVGSLGKSK